MKYLLNFKFSVKDIWKFYLECQVIDNSKSFLFHKMQKIFFKSNIKFYVLHNVRRVSKHKME